MARAATGVGARRLAAALTPIAGAAVAGAALLGLLALSLELAGYDAQRALGALWAGSFGSSYAISSATLVRATPLALCGLAVALAFRAGVLNIGAEGQLLVGAAAAAALAVGQGQSANFGTLVAALAAGATAGACWAGIAAVLRRRFHVLEVISTIMLNFVAANLVAYLVRGPLQEAQHIYPQTETIARAARLAPLFPGTRLHAGALLAVGAAVALWWMLRATAAGFRVRVAGASPSAAAAAGGIDVARVTSRAFLASGALAGLAGAVELLGVTYALYENLSPGYGYTAIAVALLARLHPLGVLATAALFGALEAGATAMQRDAGVPSVVVTVIEALLILLALAVTRRRLTRSLPADSALDSAPASPRLDTSAP